MRYGFKNYKFNLKKKIKIKSLNFSFNYHKNNYNKNSVYMYLPSDWHFIFFKNAFSPFSNIYFYNKIYYFNFFLIKNFNFFKIEHQLRLIKIYYNNNNFFKLYFNFFYLIFSSFNFFFFTKLKFKGKGYYIFKNIRNSLVFQFGYSHKINMNFFFFKIKFLNKTTVLFFGINKFDIFKNALKFKQVKPINIFTLKGIRFSKQIIYKKIGKISSYR